MSFWMPAAVGNYGTRGAAAVDLVVCHHTAGTRDAAIQRFQTPGANVSAHFIVDQDATIYQMVATTYAAYHCGNYDTNQHSIGIEHVSEPGGDHFTDAQYAASGALIAQLAQQFGFPVDAAHVIPHNQVVVTQCPGALDLTRLIEGDDMTPDEHRWLAEVRGMLLVGSAPPGPDNPRSDSRSFLEDMRDDLSRDYAAIKTDTEALLAHPSVAGATDPALLALVQQIRAHFS